MSEHAWVSRENLAGEWRQAPNTPTGVIAPEFFEDKKQSLCYNNFISDKSSQFEK